MRQIGRHDLFRKLRDHKALLEAAKGGDATAIMNLVAAGADVNFPPEDDCTMSIHLAAKGNHVEALRVLLKAGGRTDLMSSDSEPPLHIAARAGAIDTVNVLLDEAGSRVDATDQFGCPALIAALEKRNLPIIRALLSAGADPNHLAEVCDNGAFTALRLAVERDCVDSINLLISAGANPNRPFYTRQLEGVTPVHWACRLARSDCLETLLRRGGDPSREEGGGVSLSDYTARPAGLKASDVVGAGNPCERSSELSDERAVVRERIFTTLRSAEDRRSGWGRRKTLVILRALRAREPEGTLVGGTEEKCEEHRESALEALQAVWERQKIVAEDRRQLFAAVKHSRMAARKLGVAFNELNTRRFRPPMLSLQGEDLAIAEKKLQEDFDAFSNAEPEPRLDEIGIRRKLVRNRELRQVANEERGRAVDLERRGILERLTRHNSGSLPAAIFQMVMTYI
ncbi:unnamed protein product [Pylaiella littoralis]